MISEKEYDEIVFKERQIWASFFSSLVAGKEVVLSNELDVISETADIMFDMYLDRFNIPQMEKK